MMKSLLFRLIANDLNPYDFKLICVIHYYTDDYAGMSIVPYETLAEDMGMTRRNVMRNVKRIEEKGYVKVYRRNDKNNWRIINGYKILI